jgi:CRP/FNR family transcriptional regulator, anaerobic regulatory protein
MSKDLKNFLRSYGDFQEEELADMAGRFKTIPAKGHEYLLRPGEVCKHLLFIQKGCVRLYYLKDDMEVSVWFSFEHTSAIEVYSFISGQPTNYYLQAIEDSEVLSLSKHEIDKLCEGRPNVQGMMKRFWEDVLLNLISRFTALQTDSAEKRYLDLLARPPYLKAIPLKYLASFIGVTPTSLSRIRRKVSRTKLP